MVGRAVSRLVRRERSWESTSLASAAAAAPRMIHSATAFVVVLQLLASCLLASVTAATSSLEKKVIDFFVTIAFDQAPSIKRVEDAARRKNPDRGIIWRFLPPPGFFVLE
jgi:Ni,Fe-hydrogenase I cytochrome b subunit